MKKKKYFVRLRGDRVVSVDVDGVRYAGPEDIPDERDRRKVRRLIARRMGREAAAEAAAEDGGTRQAAGFAESFDREFEADLRELRESSLQGTRLIMLIFLGVAAIVLTVAAFSTRIVLRTQAREEQAPGRVVDLVVRTHRDSSTGEKIEITYPVVEFALPGRPPQAVQMREGSSPPDYAVGDEVTIVVDPQQPGTARIKSLSGTLLRWLVPAISAVVGTAFVLAAILAVRVGGESAP